jgi:hypothetical protein
LSFFAASWNSRNATAKFFCWYAAMPFVKSAAAGAGQQASSSAMIHAAGFLR